MILITSENERKENSFVYNRCEKSPSCNLDKTDSTVNLVEFRRCLICSEVTMDYTVTVLLTLNTNRNQTNWLKPHQ